jgi:hypothetical protein
MLKGRNVGRQDLGGRRGGRMQWAPRFPPEQTIAFRRILYFRVLSPEAARTTA